MANNLKSLGQPEGAPEKAYPPSPGSQAAQPKAPSGYQAVGKSLSKIAAQMDQMKKYSFDLETPSPIYKSLKFEGMKTPTSPMSSEEKRPTGGPQMTFQPLDPRKGGPLLLPEGCDPQDMLTKILEASSNPEGEGSSAGVPFGHPGYQTMQIQGVTIVGPPGNMTPPTYIPSWIMEPPPFATPPTNLTNWWAWCSQCDAWHSLT